MFQGISWVQYMGRCYKMGMGKSLGTDGPAHVIFMLFYKKYMVDHGRGRSANFDPNDQLDVSENVGYPKSSIDIHFMGNPETCTTRTCTKMCQFSLPVQVKRRQKLQMIRAGLAARQRGADLSVEDGSIS